MLLIGKLKRWQWYSFLFSMMSVFADFWIFVEENRNPIYIKLKLLRDNNYRPLAPHIHTHKYNSTCLRYMIPLNLSNILFSLLASVSEKLTMLIHIYEQLIHKRVSYFMMEGKKIFYIERAIWYHTEMETERGLTNVLKRWHY